MGCSQEGGRQRQVGESRASTASSSLLYEPLPKNVKLYYDGKAVDLHVEAEEVATFFGSMLHSTQNVENPVFQKNFFNDFKDILKSTGGAKDRQGNKLEIKEFSKLDFTKIFEHYKGISDARKARSSAEKKAEKAEKDKLEAPYMFCKWDGRKEKVGNFGSSLLDCSAAEESIPKTGTVKKRVLPEQVTINIGKGAKVPEPPAGHKWKAVQHDNKATWLAMWQEERERQLQVCHAGGQQHWSGGQADFKKFEKARTLKKHIDRIRADYTKELKSDVMAERQRATAMYLIDEFALRAGNEKDTDNEAETVGCCSLKYEHVTLQEPTTVIFDFLGKDSIRFYNEVQVSRQVFKNLRMFKKPPKTDGDDIFDRLNVGFDTAAFGRLFIQMTNGRRLPNSTSISPATCPGSLPRCSVRTMRPTPCRSCSRSSRSPTPRLPRRSSSITTAIARSPFSATIREPLVPPTRLRWKS